MGHKQTQCGIYKGNTDQVPHNALVRSPHAPSSLDVNPNQKTDLSGLFRVVIIKWRFRAMDKEGREGSSVDRGVLVNLKARGDSEGIFKFRGRYVVILV